MNLLFQSCRRRQLPFATELGFDLKVVLLIPEVDSSEDRSSLRAPKHAPRIVMQSEPKHHVSCVLGLYLEITAVGSGLFDPGCGP